MKQQWIHAGNAWCALLTLVVLLSPGLVRADENAPGRLMARQATMTSHAPITADHSKFEELKFDPVEQRSFKGPEVTRACLGCHNQASIQFHKTIHWTWRDPISDPERKIGKGGLTVNNFCVAVPSNETRCTSCHAGYGWKDKDFDFNNPETVDCLVCHEQTGEYDKFPTMAGYPAPWIEDPENPGQQLGKEFSGGKVFYAPNWSEVAQSVGRPDRTNCGTCHFYGGGGDAVKHGDLDSSLSNPDKHLDVHMGDKDSGGQEFACIRCHTTKAHDIAGRIYSNPAVMERKSLVENDLQPKIMCESCHTDSPHAAQKMNDHTDRVACQSCHIPTFARVKPTKMWWDWSKAGDKDREPVLDENGKPDYVKKKGEFVWAKDVVPEYHWFNGAMTTTTAEDRIDPTAEVLLQWPIGGRNDPNSRIMPFKVHRGKTPYDPVNNTMALPHLFPTGKDDTTAYWKNFDWRKSLEHGMSYAGVPFSGEYDFVETAFAYPTTHMVAPKDNVVQCEECHSRNGRLANLAGFYMPGRDRVQAIDYLGWAGVAGSVIAVFIHGLLRMLARTRREG
jgi:octaheme c-type cytochrome (tetrathionate reductase family)